MVMMIMVVPGMIVIVMVVPVMTMLGVIVIMVVPVMTMLGMIVIIMDVVGVDVSTMSPVFRSIRGGCPIHVFNPEFRQLDSTSLNNQHTQQNGITQHLGSRDNCYGNLIIPNREGLPVSYLTEKGMNRTMTNDVAAPPPPLMLLMPRVVSISGQVAHWGFGTP